MKYAWVEGGFIRDLSKADPTMVFHPDVAANYTEQVPNAARVGDGWDGTTLTPKADPIAPAPSATYRTVVTATEFQFLFTAAERTAIASSVDPEVVNTRALLLDPRMLEVDLAKPYIVEYFNTLDTLALITKARKTRMLNGRFPKE